ncbi:hypothetical protein ACU8NH_11460 [Rhizobium leguminosarum]|jgi:hypothetical protein|uniref:Uncharacterized protein n=2 Tax=Rhizobium leguminosarum TaxID=384 RepID=A0A1B8RFC2_RHILT|nr:MULTISPECIES: hypothetical protein [Rhizobium]AOO89470.1 hypothetical protein [Rhizobium leguminosarum bv. trifolii]MBA9029576.1 hypothetical protein [Rhizobium leguminosarum]MBY5462708.1 hypothetical protein [Rhizobium leguminosarum]MBY5901232.1 hypothetical protein [Rhizobium leguminosarum]MBY5907433.1 hypothetical protein [Rhizobium leguminosarum]
MTQLLSISANTAAVAFESLRIPQRVATSTAARDARRAVDRQLKAEGTEEIDEPSSIIQSTEVALDLMAKGNRQPQSGLKQALRSYEDF